MTNHIDLFNQDGEYDETPDDAPLEQSPVAQMDDDEIDEVLEEVDERFSEAEKRITLAGYYSQLARGGIFKDHSKEAAIVDREVKAFAQGRMEILLGMKADLPEVEAPPPLFTEEEVFVLRQFCQRLIDKQAQKAPEPALQTIAPPKPVAIAATRTMTPPAPPIMRKPAAKPLQPQLKRPEPKKPEPKRVPKSKVPPKGTRDEASIPIGEMFEVGGKTFKFVETPDGERRRIQVQKRVEAPGKIPMPQGDQFTATTAAQAMQQTAGPAQIISAILPTR